MRFMIVFSLFWMVLSSICILFDGCMQSHYVTNLIAIFYPPLIYINVGWLHYSFHTSYICFFFGGGHGLPSYMYILYFVFLFVVSMTTEVLLLWIYRLKTYNMWLSLKEIHRKMHLFLCTWFTYIFEIVTFCWFLWEIKLNLLVEHDLYFID